MVELAYINTNDLKRIKKIIKILRGNTNLVTNDFLKSRNMPDIASISI